MLITLLTMVEKSSLVVCKMSYFCIRNNQCGRHAAHVPQNNAKNIELYIRQ